MNSFILIGEIIDEPISKETNTGKKYSKLIVKEKRPFKNNNDEYENDTYEVVFWGSTIANDLVKGDKIAIKGRMQSYDFEKESNIYHNVELVGEKLNIYHEIF